MINIINKYLTFETIIEFLFIFPACVIASPIYIFFFLFFNSLNILYNLFLIFLRNRKKYEAYHFTLFKILLKAYFKNEFIDNEIRNYQHVSFKKNMELHKNCLKFEVIAYNTNHYNQHIHPLSSVNYLSRFYLNESTLENELQATKEEISILNPIVNLTINLGNLLQISNYFIGSKKCFLFYETSFNVIVFEKDKDLKEIMNDLSKKELLMRSL